MEMPFGKYKGRTLDELPEEYVSWLLEQQWLKPHMRRALEERNEVHPVERLIRKWHSAMALKFHPDRGGSTEAMQAVNDGADLLRKLVEEME